MSEPCQALQAILDWNDDQQTPVLPVELVAQARRAVATKDEAPSRRRGSQSPANRQCKSCGDPCGNDYQCYSCAWQDEQERIDDLHMELQREACDE